MIKCSNISLMDPPTTPPRVDYALTPMGSTLLVPVMGLAAWAAEHRLAMQEARGAFDAAHPEALEPLAAGTD